MHKVHALYVYLVVALTEREHSSGFETRFKLHGRGRRHCATLTDKVMSALRYWHFYPQAQSKSNSRKLCKEVQMALKDSKCFFTLLKSVQH